MGVVDVRDLLNQHGFRFSRSMGQNFLIDGNITGKIVRLSGIDRACGVLEVGPGFGALTVELCNVAGFVTAVELDERLLPILSDTLSGLRNVEIIPGDILKLDIKKLVTEKMPDFKYHVCANLPYNITSPAISAFIKSSIFASITVMVQREVARRICAKPSSQDYSAFSVFISYYTEPKSLFDVPPECFMPRPSVWSSVVTLTSRADRLYLDEPESERLYFSIVRAAFGQRRKTLVNALHSVFGDSMGKDEIVAMVEKCGFDTRVRGEMLGIEDFAKLTDYIQNGYKGLVKCDS